MAERHKELLRHWAIGFLQRGPPVSNAPMSGATPRKHSGEPHAGIVIPVAMLGVPWSMALVQVDFNLKSPTAALLKQFAAVSVVLLKVICPAGVSLPFEICGEPLPITKLFLMIASVAHPA